MIPSIQPAVKTPLYRQNIKPKRERRQDHNGRLKTPCPVTRQRLTQAPPARTTFEDFLLLQTQADMPKTAIKQQSHKPYQRRPDIPAATFRLQA